MSNYEIIFLSWIHILHFKYVWNLPSLSLAWFFFNHIEFRTMWTSTVSVFRSFQTRLSIVNRNVHDSRLLHFCTRSEFFLRIFNRQNQLWCIGAYMYHDFSTHISRSSSSKKLSNNRIMNGQICIFISFYISMNPWNSTWDNQSEFSHTA